jgi:hypothetical protein
LAAGKTFFETDFFSSLLRLKPDHPMVVGQHHFGKPVSSTIDVG